MLHLVEENLPCYEACGSSRKKKKQVAADLVREMQTKHHARFLTQESGVWMVVHDDIAREKVTNMFRSRRRALSNSWFGNRKQASSETIAGATRAADGVPAVDETVETRKRAKPDM